MVLSLEPDAMLFPSGENATEVTQLVCPVRGLPNCSPVSASHKHMVLSVEPDAILFPSAENVTEVKTCPLIVS